MSVARCLPPVVAVAVGAVTGVVTIAWSYPARGAATIVVNTPADEDIDDGSCSLREAIVAANSNASYHGCTALGAGVDDQIVFDLGPGGHTINVGETPLPSITQWVTIDGGAARVELHGPGGPLVSGQHGLTVTPEGFGTVIRNLIVNNFADNGILIDADEVSVFGCFIGTDATGTISVPNQGFGVQVSAGNGVRIGGATSGGACTGDCNVIAGATPEKANVLLDLGSTGALVRGNFIGTDVTGTAPITPSTTIGIADKGHGNRIGGTVGTTPGGPCTGDCNLISGNSLSGGIVLNQAATGSVVQGNFIGTDVTGTTPVIGTAGAFGINSFAAGAMIGGTTPAARNVVSGNPVGIYVAGSNTIVQGNYLGSDAAGMAAMPNSGPGVIVSQADGVTIGGTAAGAGNLISGTSIRGYGVGIQQATNTHLLGNLIGTAADGTTPLPNASHGVLISDQSSNSVIGNPVAGADNTIAFNGGDGIRIDGGAPPVRANSIHGNSIYSNGGAGIALISNANDNIAPPIITGVDPVHGTACAPCVVEIYSDSDDEGRLYDGVVFTNDDGTWTFDGSVHGPHITATNTDMTGNTSQFSAPVSLLTATPSGTLTATPSPTVPTPTRSRTRTASATSTYTATSTGTSTRTPTVVATLTTTVSPGAAATATPALPTPTPTNVPCTGDCNGDGMVAISELITGVNIVLGASPVSACSAFADTTGVVDIARLITGVSNALNGCRTASA